MYFSVKETEMYASVNKQSVGGSFLTKQSKGVSRERDVSEVSRLCSPAAQSRDLLRKRLSLGLLCRESRIKVRINNFFSFGAFLIMAYTFSLSLSQ